MERSFSASAPATKPSTNHSQDLKSHVSLQPEEQSSSNMEASVSQVASHSSSQRTALERAALYEALIKKRKDHIDSSYSPVYRLPPHIIGGLSDIVEKSKQCNCRRSACLKLYCECFSSGIYCSVFCSCVPCNNNDSSAENEKLRSLAVLGILEKNQHAFRSKSLIATKEPNGSLIGLDNSSTTDDIFLKSSPSKEVRMQASSVSKRRYGCSCRKSSCLKKYCECSQSNLLCNPQFCRCVDCKNVAGATSELDLPIKQNESILCSSTGNTGNVETKQNSRKRARSSQTAQSERAAFDGIILDSFLPPSYFASPFYLEGAKAPAICFGLSASNSSLKVNSTNINESKKVAAPSNFHNCENEETDLQVNDSVSICNGKDKQKDHGVRSCFTSADDTPHKETSAPFEISLTLDELQLSNLSTEACTAEDSKRTASVELCDGNSPAGKQLNLGKETSESSMSSINSPSMISDNVLKHVKELTTRIFEAAKAVEVNYRGSTQHNIKDVSISPTPYSSNDSDGDDLRCLDSDTDLNTCVSNRVLQDSTVNEDRSFFVMQQTAILRYVVIHIQNA